jgi:hypothetical protein
MGSRWLVPLAVGLAWGCERGGEWSPDAGGDAGPDDAAADVATDVPGDAAEAAPDAVADGLPDGPADPWVRIVYPTEGEEAPNPVTFRWEASPEVVSVELFCDDWPLQSAPIPVEAGEHTYTFSGVNYERRLVLTGYDGDGAPIASDEVTFVPYEELCAIPDAAGFNHYTISAINDWTRFPKDGTHPYCWSYYGDTCGANWGQIYDGRYGGETLFPGGGDCFCSGHTLEIFLRAYRLWLDDRGFTESVLFSYAGAVLPVASVDLGSFYQWWQGFGVASTASSAQAFERAGIGRELDPAEWDSALPGDYANLSRSTGSGHAVIFIDWIRSGGEIVGLRYYGCNGSGHSCPDPDDPLDTTGNSGPSFATEYFTDHGGTVIPRYLFIGRVFLPTDP